MLAVYADVLFLVNLAINYILLLVTAKICALRLPRLRLLAAAALGAAYSVAVLLPGAGFLESPVMKVAAGVAMVVVAFAGMSGVIRLSLVFFAVSAAFGGAVMAASLISGGRAGGLLPAVSLEMLVVSFAASYVVLALVFRRAGRRRGAEIVEVKLRHGGREVSIRALKDTGNALTDPVSGRPVVVAGVSDVGALFPRGLMKTVLSLRTRGAVEVLEELAESEEKTRFQLVPYSAVGVSGGVLLAFRPDEVVIGGERRDGTLLALSPNSISEGGAYSALVGA